MSPDGAHAAPPAAHARPPSRHLPCSRSRARPRRRGRIRRVPRSSASSTSSASRTSRRTRSSSSASTSPTRSCSSSSTQTSSASNSSSTRRPGVARPWQRRVDVKRDNGRAPALHVASAALEAKHVGVFALLDEESRLQKGNAESYVEKLKNQQKQSAAFSVPKGRAKGAGAPFSISHYAGLVTYDTRSSFRRTPTRSTPSSSRWRRARPLLTSPSSSPRRLRRRARPPRSGGRDALATIGSTFKTQLNELMTMIGATDVHYRALREAERRVGAARRRRTRRRPAAIRGDARGRPRSRAPRLPPPARAAGRSPGTLARSRRRWWRRRRRLRWRSAWRSC